MGVNIRYHLDLCMTGISDVQSNKMKGTTIETEKKQFANMQNTFDTIVKDIKAYSTFLTQAAESYEAAEREGTQKAQEQGKVF